MRVAELGANLTWQLEQVIGSDISVALSGCTAKTARTGPGGGSPSSSPGYHAPRLLGLNRVDERD